MTIEEVEAMLSWHIQIERTKRCICGWRPDYKADNDNQWPASSQHRRHVAEVIANG